MGNGTRAPSGLSAHLTGRGPGAARGVAAMGIGSRAVTGACMLLLALSGGVTMSHGEGGPAVAGRSREACVEALVARHGEALRPRIERGVAQLAALWRPEDGDDAAFEAFCREQFLADDRELAATFHRLEGALEQVFGRLHEIERELRTPLDLDTGPILEIDRRLARLDFRAPLQEDLFRTGVAHLCRLNYPVHTLAERLAAGPGWDRETWARSRMMDLFAERVPPDVGRRITDALARASEYVDGYWIRADRLLGPGGKPLFPAGKRLIAHWGLRDEIKADYALGAEGLARQRLLEKVMERIVRQEIPLAVIDNPDLWWDPVANRVTDAAGREVPTRLGEREPDRRYATILAVFQAERAVDPYTPSTPSFLARTFERDIRVPVDEVESLFSRVLDSEEVRRTARLIERRLGRPLEPFDLWYAGFRPGARHDEEDLDRRVRERWPDVAAFQRDLPRILETLGFAPERARWLAARIVVDPARGAGHAMAAEMRGRKAHLRTHAGAGGFDYKGFNIAMHELGHNVEQVFSLDGIDHWFLRGVPDSACTEAFAFLFQERDLEVLGLGRPDEESRREQVLGKLWSAYEIMGVALVDIGTWRWLYRHPEATPAELREAVLRIARETWNRHYAPVFGRKDVELLAVYSHMISYPLYLPNYPLGELIAFQLRQKVRGEAFGREFERIARQGALTPDLWMKRAVGSGISAEPLLAAARRALDASGEGTDR